MGVLHIQPRIAICLVYTMCNHVQPYVTIHDLSTAYMIMYSSAPMRQLIFINRQLSPSRDLCIETLRNSTLMLTVFCNFFELSSSTVNDGTQSGQGRGDKLANRTREREGQGQSENTARPLTPPSPIASNSK